MPDRLEIEATGDQTLKRSLERIDWPIDYGQVKIQVRAGKPTLITVERTIKLD